jgi:LmbE family N-acetylglucosaminyl deacetylase
MFPWLGTVASDLASTRMREAKTAMGSLGVPERNLHFLQLPDGKLSKHRHELSESLKKLFYQLRPSCVLMPFRYDRHSDHLALHHAVIHAVRNQILQIEIFEYFVYYRWSLLPGKDLRRFVRPDQLVTIDTQNHASRKQQALERYTSQTTLFSAWQDRPILPRERVVEVSCSPECFVRYDPQFSRSSIFSHAATWVRLVHAVEPFLKEQKERVRALTRLRSSLRFRRKVEIKAEAESQARSGSG